LKAQSKILAIIPTLNEAEMIGQIVDSVKRHVDGVFIIDGNSSDGTAQIAKRSGASVILQVKNGKGQALRQAFSSIKGDITVILDADGSMSAEEIPLLTQSLEENPEID